MEPKTPQQQAILFMAACERPEPDKYEKTTVRLARKWLSILNSPQTTQGVVNKLLEELDAAHSDDFGSIWNDLRKSVLEWAVKEEWLDDFPE